MRALVPGVLFFATYIVFVYSLAYTTIVFGEPSDAGLLGVGGFAILLCFYSGVAALAGSLAVSLFGLSTKTRVALSGLFIVLIGTALFILNRFFESARPETIMSLSLPFVFAGNIVLAALFVRIGLSAARKHTKREPR